MRHRHVRRLALEIMTETVAVARALDIRLEKVSGTLDLDWIALTDAERLAAGSPGLVAKHALLLAVGARYRRLRSSMLAAIGGLMGVAISWVVALIVRNTTLVPMEIPVNAVLIGVTLSAAVGLFFGIYPARRASRLDPIVALRAEN